jgi:indolepyruvate ferredoxin oxidoreductase
MGTADLMLAADLAVASNRGVLERNSKHAAVIGNLDLAASAEFKRNAALPIDVELHRGLIERATDAGASVYLHGVRLAERLFGDAQAMNTLLLGLAWQRGLIPVGEAAIRRAIELNGAAVKTNLRAFLWGRILVENPELINRILDHASNGPPETLEALIDSRADALRMYQSRRYAQRYRSLVTEVAAREISVLGKPGRLARAAAEGLFRVMAYKDEYEIARLHASTHYGRKPVFHLAPPLITRVDPATGRRRKVSIPGWIALPLFQILQYGRILRGSAFDVFGRQVERGCERALIEQYEADLRATIAALRTDNLDVAVALAELPDQIRGFGPVKEANRRKAEARRVELLARLRPAPAMEVAA